MKNLCNLLIVLAIFNVSNIIASEGQHDTEINPFLRQYKAVDESDVTYDESITEDDTDNNDENDGNYGFYYGNKALREINKYNKNRANYDDKTVIENTNKVITVKGYEQLQKINHS